MSAARISTSVSLPSPGAIAMPTLAPMRMWWPSTSIGSAMRLTMRAARCAAPAGSSSGPVKQRELVAAETGDDILAAAAIAQPLGDVLQDGIARGVAEAVVDELEMVEVDGEHGEAFRRARCGGGRWP